VTFDCFRSALRIHFLGLLLIISVHVDHVKVRSRVSRSLGDIMERHLFLMIITILMISIVISNTCDICVNGHEE
jgi:hypothetical protein